MNTNIFVPKKINVGFQNRKDTYTGKLAYVIYFDERGKLRKETSWNGWRDKNIDNEIYDNEPTTGFVLNKKVGGVEECWGWDPRKTYTRVYDPRGFEFEITIPNLLWILENSNCIKGKGLEGEFVYGWDGKELLLVPVDSADYKEIERKNKIFHNNEFIKAKDLKVGATYLSKNDVKYVYMGKFEKYEQGYWKNGLFFTNYKKMVKYCDENNIPPTKKYNGYWTSSRYEADKWDFGPIGKQHCFYYSWTSNGVERSGFEWKTSISKFLINVVDENCNENYATYFDLLERQPSYSMPDANKVTYHTIPIEEFAKKVISSYGSYYHEISFYANINGKIDRYRIATNGYGKNEYILRKYTDNYSSVEVVDIFPVTSEEKAERYWPYKKYTEHHMIPVTWEEIYNKMKPMYQQTYLTNGKEYTKGY